MNGREAEAAVAEMLFEGQSLESDSERLHIAINTAKTHLHHVFVMCDVHLQGQPKGAHPPVFRPVAGPGANELQRLVERIGAQVRRALERLGLIERDLENAWLASDPEAGPLDDLIGHSITCRMAAGPSASRGSSLTASARRRSSTDASGCSGHGRRPMPSVLL